MRWFGATKSITWTAPTECGLLFASSTTVYVQELFPSSFAAFWLLELHIFAAVFRSIAAATVSSRNYVNAVSRYIFVGKTVLPRKCFLVPWEVLAKPEQHQREDHQQWQLMWNRKSIGLIATPLRMYCATMHFASEAGNDVCIISSCILFSLTYPFWKSFNEHQNNTHEWRCNSYTIRRGFRLHGLLIAINKYGRRIGVKLHFLHAGSLQ